MVKRSEIRRPPFAAVLVTLVRAKAPAPLICSSWRWVDTCWTKSVAWMPWNRPESHPTSCPWATRSSASVGGAIVEGNGEPVELLGELCGQRPFELADRLVVDLLHPCPARVVERGRADLLEELLGHRGDPHELGGRGYELFFELAGLGDLGRDQRT